MRKIIKNIIILVFLLAGFFLAARLLVGGGEDTWICVNGEWVKHGVPSAPMPQKPCGEAAETSGVGLADPAAVDYSTFQTEDGIFSLDYPVSWTRAEIEDLGTILPEDFVNKYSLTMPLLLSNLQEAIISLSIYHFDDPPEADSGTDLETAMDALEVELEEMGRPYNEISREMVGDSLVVDSTVDEQGTTMQIRDILYLGQGGVVYNLSLVAPQESWGDYETIFNHIQTTAKLSP